MDYSAYKEVQVLPLCGETAVSLAQECPADAQSKVNTNTTGFLWKYISSH
jgi:hypothetical protein